MPATPGDRPKANAMPVPVLTSRPPLVQVLATVLWPSFLLAGMATGVYFTVFDPLEVLLSIGQPLLSRMAAYSLGFFGFWLLAAASSATTVYFLRPSESFNRPARPS